MNRLCIAALLLVSHFMLAGETAVNAPTAEGITERIHAGTLAWFDGYLKKTAELTPVAEAIADRIIAGGSLYVTGDPAFADEWNFRAGGLAGVKIWQQGTRMTATDVMLIGITTPNDRMSRVFQGGVIGEGWGGFTQALTVYIGSLNWPQISRIKEMAPEERWKDRLKFLDTGAPDADGWENICIGQTSTLAVSWALEVEIVAALSRKGKTAAVLGSMFAPGANDHNKAIGGKLIIDEPKLEPIAAGKLSGEYLGSCRKWIAAFIEKQQAPRLRAAAQKIAECQKRKGVIFTLGNGHFWPKGVSIPPALSRVVLYGAGWQWENFKGMKPEDTLLYIGYITYSKEAVDAALKAGSDAIVQCVEDVPAHEKVASFQATWEKWDAVVEIPNYPYKAAPPSAVVQLPQWYSLMAEAEALLKK